MMQVKAVKGVRVPVEGSPHKYITDEAVVSVERTTYYLRRLADGDLVEMKAVKSAPKNAKEVKDGNEH